MEIHTGSIATGSLSDKEADATYMISFYWTLEG